MFNRYVIFDEAKFTVSQQVERMKNKGVSQQMEVDATPLSSIGSVSVEISSDVTPGRDRVAVLDTELVNLIAVERTKLNP